MATYKTVLKSQIWEENVLYTAPMGKTSVLISAFIANRGTNITSVSLFIQRAGTSYFIVYTIPLAIGSTVQPNDGRKVFLEAGDVLMVSSDDLVDVVCSLIEDI